MPAATPQAVQAAQAEFAAAKAAFFAYFPLCTDINSKSAEVAGFTAEARTKNALVTNIPNPQANPPIQYNSKEDATAAKEVIENADKAVTLNNEIQQKATQLSQLFQDLRAKATALQQLLADVEAQATAAAAKQNPFLKLFDTARAKFLGKPASVTQSCSQPQDQVKPNDTVHGYAPLLAKRPIPLRSKAKQKQLKPKFINRKP